MVRADKKHKREKTSFTLRLEEELLRRIDRVATDANVSRQKLVEAILKKALADKDFSVEVE